MGTYSGNFKSKLYTYFIQQLGAFDYRKGWLKCNCPHCGKELKYGINLSLNRTNCFVCGANPTPKQLIKDLENLRDDFELLEFLKDVDGTTYKFKEEKVELASKATDLGMPEGYNLIGYDDGSFIAKSAINYLKKRGFDIKYLRSKGWGYCDKGDLFGYIVIPFFEKGELVYYNTRRFLGNGPRYKNPGTEESGLGKSFIIYNKEALYMFDKVYLCEGAINASTIGEKGIASGGKHLSRYQINEILKSPVKDVVILLDPDAKMKAVELALNLGIEKRVKVVFLPEGKDVNDLGRSITMQYVRETPFLDYQQILRLKNKIHEKENNQLNG